MTEVINSALRDNLRSIILLVFKANKLREESWIPEENGYGRTLEDCYIEICGGDQLCGETIGYFDYWWGDIETVAAHLGLAYERDPDIHTITVREDIPPAPSPEYWWDTQEQKWVTVDISEVAEESSV